MNANAKGENKVDNIMYTRSIDIHVTRLDNLLQHSKYDFDTGKTK